MSWVEAKSKGRVSGYVFQPRLIQDLPTPEFTPSGPYTRTRVDFWEKDTLDTAILIRDIFPGNQQDWEVELLKDAWKWYKENNKKPKAVSLEVKPGEKTNLPPPVLLNASTLGIVQMKDAFRTYCNAPVAFMPDTQDWKEDVRGVVVGFVDKIRSKMSYELGHMDKIEQSDSVETGEIAEQLDLDMDITHRLRTIDSITGTLLNQYHIELLKREKAIFNLASQ